MRFLVFFFFSNGALCMSGIMTMEKNEHFWKALLWRQVSTASVCSKGRHLGRVSTAPRMLHCKPSCKGEKCAGRVFWNFLESAEAQSILGCSAVICSGNQHLQTPPPIPPWGGRSPDLGVVKIHTGIWRLWPSFLLILYLYKLSLPGNHEMLMPEGTWHQLFFRGKSKGFRPWQTWIQIPVQAFVATGKTWFVFLQRFSGIDSCVHGHTAGM